MVGVSLRPDKPLNLLPASVGDFREQARRALPRQLFDYIDGGSYGEVTMAANVADLAAVKLRQRVMRDVSHVDTSTEVLGQPMGLPVVLAPVGLGGMFATRAEVSAARAAEAHDVVFCESTVSICSMEEVAAATTAPFWYQLYVMRDRTVAEGLMARASALGCPVLVLTVDLAVVGERYRDTRNAMVGPAPGLAKVRRALDLLSHPQWLRSVALGGKPLTFGNLAEIVPGARTPQDFKVWVDSQFDASVTWEDVSWVRAHWPGKLVVKGVLDADDARRAADAGVDGLVVSNHGGRQLDATPSTAAALPAVVAAVGDQLEVLVDGGVRSGLDVVKMLALGAKACLIGRPWAWAVAGGGQAGVDKVLDVMRHEMEVAMALTGVIEVADIGPETLVTEPVPSRH